MADPQGRTFSPCRLIGLMGVLIVISGCILIGTGARMFVNFPSLAIVFGIAFFALLATFGMDFLKFIPQSLLTFVSSTPEPNAGFAEIALFTSRYIIGAGLIGMIIGLIQMLSNLSDPSGIGVGMATAMLTPFYAIVTSEIFCAFLYKAYSTGDRCKQSKPLPLNNVILPTAVTAFTLTLFFVLIISLTNFNG